MPLFVSCVLMLNFVLSFFVNVIVLPLTLASMIAPKIPRLLNALVALSAPVPPSAIAKIGFSPAVTWPRASTVTLR